MKINPNIAPLGMTFNDMMHRVFRIVRKRSGKAKVRLTIEQFGIVFALGRNEHGFIQQEMADLLGKDKSSMLRMIDLLEKKGVVRRTPDADDRRKNHLSLTPFGMDVFENYWRTETSLKAEVFSGLTQAEVDNFYKVILHIQKKLEEM